jgi:arylsulfatase A-like enzyme
MRRRDFLAGLGATPLAAKRRLPNIVYILADDLGYGDLGCYNSDSRIPTPAYDRFAGQGVRFTDAHSPSSVCTPTRYGILTGRYCWRSRMKSGVLDGYSANLIEPGRRTAASLLRERGYRTGCIGKWHLGLGTQEPANFDRLFHPSPLDHGFDYFFGISASLDMAPYCYVENRQAVERPTASTPGRNDPRGVFWREGPIAPGFKLEDVLDTLAQKAGSFVRQEDQRPFFLYLPLTGPHTPWLPTGPFRGRSKAGDYGDFVTQVDDAVGRVLAALPEDTLVILTSDNGAHWLPSDIAKYGHLANRHLRGMKADIWDAGHRIPFLARWPGRIAPGTVSSHLVCLTDFMATAADLTGAKLPADAAEDSFSMLPALLGKKPRGPVRQAIVHHSSLGMFSIRQGEWKLVLGRGSGGFTEPRKLDPAPGEPLGELYNLAKDPSERDNLYQRYPGRVGALTALLDQYKREGRSRPV